MRYNLCITFILDHHFALKGESGIEVHFDDNKNVPITLVLQICNRKTESNLSGSLITMGELQPGPSVCSLSHH